jgi:hypothetical protein
MIGQPSSGVMSIVVARVFPAFRPPTKARWRTSSGGGSAMRASPLLRLRLRPGHLCRQAFQTGDQRVSARTLKIDSADLPNKSAIAARGKSVFRDGTIRIPDFKYAFMICVEGFYAGCQISDLVMDTRR